MRAPYSHANAPGGLLLRTQLQRFSSEALAARPTVRGGLSQVGYPPERGAGRGRVNAAPLPATVHFSTALEGPQNPSTSVLSGKPHRDRCEGLGTDEPGVRTFRGPGGEGCTDADLELSAAKVLSRGQRPHPDVSLQETQTPCRRQPPSAGGLRATLGPASDVPRRPLAFAGCPRRVRRLAPFPGHRPRHGQDDHRRVAPLSAAPRRAERAQPSEPRHPPPRAP